MRHIGIIAFGITIGVLAPAAIIELGAGPKQRAMLFAPSADSFDVNGTKVHVALDHTLANTGDSVKVSLDADRRVTVGIVVLGSSGTEGERVPGPPRGVAHETVTIEPHATKVVSLKLKGAAARSSDVSTYSIYVLSEKAADRLALLQRRAGPNIPTGGIPDQDSDTSRLYTVIREMGQSNIESPRDARLFGSGLVARLEAYTRPVNHAIAITAPETAPVDRPFPVAVTLTNPRQERVTLRVSMVFPKIDSEYLGLSDDVVTSDTTDTITLAKGETRTVTVHITAKKTGVVGMETNIECVEGSTCSGIFNPSAFEATQVTSAQPAVAAK